MTNIKPELPASGQGVEGGFGLPNAQGIRVDRRTGVEKLPFNSDGVPDY